MSTIEYLKKLDYDQLVFARDKANEMIQAKQAEEKKLVWRVCDGLICHNFRTEDYAKAVEKLTQVGQKRLEEYGDDLSGNRHSLKISLGYEMVMASEYESWFV